jgi:hypothetical protein
VRAIDTTAENARALRELLRQSREAYAMFEDAQRMNNWCAEMARPVRQGEIVALCKDSDRIEIVTHNEYLSDVKKVRWH